MPSLCEPVRYGDLVVGALRRFPERVAFGHDGREITYAAAADMLARWVGVLRRRGFGPGQGLGILSGNRPEVWLGQSAAPLCGGRYTALHPLGSLDDHRYACDDAEIAVLLVDPAYAERAAALTERCPSVRAVLTFGPAGVRKKDMIVSGGFNVFPREIEDVLASNPSVSAAAVIGVPDDRWGEAVKALVVLKPGATADPAELIALVRDRKGPVYAPKSLELVDALPLTPVGKADKRALRARYWAGRQRQIN